MAAKLSFQSNIEITGLTSHEDLPNILLRNELYVAFPVTTPDLAGFFRTVFT